MIKDCYISQIEATNEAGSRMIFMELAHDQVDVNLNATMNRDEFEEAVVVIRQAFKLLGQSVNAVVIRDDNS